MATWQRTADGSTLGQGGPEGGILQRDETTEAGLRLMLEADPARDFYSVTAQIPDWLVHPRFFDSLQAAEAAFEEMREPLLELAASIPAVRPPPGHPETYAAGAKLAAFTVRYS